MPPDRRRRRFRRPDTGRWLTETLPSLRIELASPVRATLTAWMRLYGEANDVQGLATGPIETRFARLRENTAADTLIVWTTPGRWASGEGLSLRFPQLHLEFTCSLGEGHLLATKVSQVVDDARPPDREPGAVGVVVHAERIPLPPEDAETTESDEGVDTLEQHFAQLAGRRWGGFAAPLSAALEAEAREDEARTQRLTVPFKDASLAHGGDEDVWQVKGVAVEALRALDDGEWLEILDDEGRARTSARVIDTHPGAGTLVIGVRTASDPPRAGFVRPRSRRKILEQKRALLEELASPTGSLPNLVRLVAAPSSMPTPRTVRPPRFVNPAVVRNRSQARAVGLALGLEDGEALLIQGPPGTGKSTTAAEIDVQLILRDPGVRILVCSHSNHGTDNMLMKVLPFLEDATERIARIGFYERIAKEARPFYAGSDVDLSDKNIIFTTIDALVLQDIAGARVYDYVIVDEANRAGVLDSLLALARGRRMIMVGDPMQLQPVMSEAEQQMVAAANGTAGRSGRRGGGRPAVVGVAQPGAQHVIGKSLFAWIQERRFAPAATVLLDQQNRMHPAIGELVSRVFYSNHVRTGPAAPRRGTGLPAFPAPVTWVDTRALKGNVESRAGGTSLFNVAEARLVTSITTHLASHAPPNLTIGVITAYAEQRDLLRRLMGPHNWPADRQLEIDTVDAFEGREKDIIVLSLVRANRRRDIGFLRLEQRLNVAISRSRRLLIVVGDTSTLREGFFGHLIATAQAVGQIVPAPKLIGQFLTRVARPRRERDERRLTEGARALPAAAGEPGAAGGDFSSDGEGAGVGVDAEGVGAGRGADGVPAAAARGRDMPSGVGSRRRRRRAWERRRERLRSLHEQYQPGSQDASAADADDGAAAPSEGATGAGPVEWSGGRDLRGDAGSRGESGSDSRGEPGSDAEAARRSDATSAREGALQPRLRARRRRRFGIPHGEEPARTPGEQVVANEAADVTNEPAPGANEATHPALQSAPETPAPSFGQHSLPLPSVTTSEPKPVGAGPTRRRSNRTRLAAQPAAGAATTDASTTDASASAPAPSVPAQERPVGPRRGRRAVGASEALAAASTSEAPAPAAAPEAAAPAAIREAAAPAAGAGVSTAERTPAATAQQAPVRARRARGGEQAPSEGVPSEGVPSAAAAGRTEAVVVGRAAEPEASEAAAAGEAPVRTRRGRRAAEPDGASVVAPGPMAAEVPAVSAPARAVRTRRPASLGADENVNGASESQVGAPTEPGVDTATSVKARRAPARRTGVESPDGTSVAQPQPAPETAHIATVAPRPPRARRSAASSNGAETSNRAGASNRAGTSTEDEPPNGAETLERPTAREENSRTVAESSGPGAATAAQGAPRPAALRSAKPRSTTRRGQTARASDD